MKVKCPKCGSARNVVGDPRYDNYMCKKCPHSFSEKEAMF